MILRNVSYADQPRMLSGVAKTVNSELALSVTKVAVVRTEPAPAIPERALEPITTERVLDWLAVQEANIRGEIAAVLANDVESINAAAISEGMSLGRAQAREKFDQEFGSSLDSLREIAKRIEVSLEAYKVELAGACAQIVGTALAKLVGKALHSPEASFSAVRQAIEHVAGAREVNLFVNARDFEVIKSREAEIAEIIGSQRFSLTVDSRVQAGGCLIESSFGEVDARWETQLLAVLDTLRGNSQTMDNDL